MTIIKSWHSKWNKMQELSPKILMWGDRPRGGRGPGRGGTLAMRGGIHGGIPSGRGHVTPVRTNIFGGRAAFSFSFQTFFSSRLNGERSDPKEMTKENLMISAELGSEQVRTCFRCGASRTPLWRRGPNGPKVVTVQCMWAQNQKEEAKLEKEKRCHNDSNTTDSKDEFSESLRKRLVARNSSLV
ncbi:hypothetical protein POM88_019180 [Heracleum sosnowskyi]|uniref:GATA-type domain-containing protein n=1 Tax=Heracleum sosnowskyi TaxID=360622 RepID=A0AAD8IVA4_9APIA|nr:hypothetical protein POM88_019180 [Heracleum sosnowskyi]